MPLGEEFQDHLKRFLKPGEKRLEKKLELVRKLVSQLGYIFMPLLFTVILRFHLSNYLFTFESNFK